MTHFIQTLHSDVLLDILKFLERNELEKCQLISNLLKKFIDSNMNFLPLRNIPSMSHVTVQTQTRNMIWSYQTIGEFFIPLLNRIQDLLGVSKPTIENSSDGKIVLYLKGHIEATEGMIQCLK